MNEEQENQSFVRTHCKAPKGPQRLASVEETHLDIVGRADMDINTSECAMEREIDEPFFVQIKAEPSFEGTSEETILEDSFETTENTEDMVSCQYAVTRSADDAGALIPPFFVPVRSQPDFEGTSEENIMEGNVQASEVTEVSMNQASFSVKEEPIDCEESWPENIKLEPACPLSMNTLSDDAEESDLHRVNVKDSSAYVARYPEAEGSLAKTCKPKKIGLESHFEGIKGGNVKLLRQRLNQRRKYPQENFGKDVASSTCVKEGASGEGEQRRFQLESCRRKCSGMEERGLRTKVNSSSKKTPSKQNKRQKKTMKGLLCGTCGKWFSCNVHLERHERIHTGEKPFQCSVCNKAFTLKSTLVDHMKTHSDERLYKCSICEASFKLSSHLKSHYRLHSGQKPYECSECDKTFNQSSSLTKHMRVHSGEKPYKCNVCGKDFSQSCHLLVHKRCHTGEKPYKCTECGSSFALCSTLNAHMRVHTSEKPYTCTECGKSFSQNSTLIKHRRVHTGERPFACELCGSRFTKLQYLQRHVNHEH